MLGGLRQQIKSVSTPIRKLDNLNYNDLFSFISIFIVFKVLCGLCYM